MKVFCLIIVSFILLIGCNKIEKEEINTVEWYKKNKPARIEKLKECRNNPGELANTPNCKNASEAQKDSLIGENSPRF